MRTIFTIKRIYEFRHMSRKRLVNPIWTLLLPLICQKRTKMMMTNIFIR